MMPSSPDREPMPGFNLFDDNFQPASFHRDPNSGVITAMELMLHRDDRTYLMRVETLELHMKRTEQAFTEGDEGDDSNTTFVVQADEILPTLLEELKRSPTEALEPYLEDQDS